MNVADDGRKRFLLVMQERESVEYQTICTQRKLECKQLINSGEQFLQTINDFEESMRKSVAKVVYGTGGNIHRGFYCPSPVWDIVVGNINRGRILKRVNAASKLSHRFGFNSNNEMLYSEIICDGEVSSTEYMVERKNVRYGFTINPDYKLEAISKEILDNNKLIRYAYLSVYPDSDGYFCSNLHIERFYYDEDGLQASEHEEFQPFVNVLEKYRYDFMKENGYLTSYTFMDYSVKPMDVIPIEYPKYVVRKKRKA